MAAAEIGRRLGVSPSRVQQVINRKGFPDPYDDLSTGKVWRTEDIEAWIAENRAYLNEGDEA